MNVNDTRNILTLINNKCMIEIRENLVKKQPIKRKQPSYTPEGGKAMNEVITMPYSKPQPSIFNNSLLEKFISFTDVYFKS